MELWLNEEWPAQQLLDEHARVAAAAADAYIGLRQRGEHDLSNIVLDLSTELLVLDFSETFVNAFDTSNKVCEMVSGCPGALKRANGGAAGSGCMVCDAPSMQPACTGCMCGSVAAVEVGALMHSSHRQRYRAAGMPGRACVHAAHSVHSVRACVQVLMRGGCDVCCTTDADKSLVRRVSELVPPLQGASASAACGLL